MAEFEGLIDFFPLQMVQRRRLPGAKEMAVEFNSSQVAEIATAYKRLAQMPAAQRTALADERYHRFAKKFAPSVLFERAGLFELLDNRSVFANRTVSPLRIRQRAAVPRLTPRSSRRSTVAADVGAPAAPSHGLLSDEAVQAVKALPEAAQKELMGLLPAAQGKSKSPGEHGRAAESAEAEQAESDKRRQRRARTPDDHPRNATGAHAWSAGPLLNGSAVLAAIDVAPSALHKKGLSPAEALLPFVCSFLATTPCSTSLPTTPC